MTMQSTDIIPTHPVNDFLLCTYCKKLLCDPVQTVCGCRLCTHCATSLIDQHDPTPCPGNHDPCEKISFTHRQFLLMKDKAAKKDLLKLQVNCPYQCDTVLTMRNLQSHVDSCDLKPIVCSYCSLLFTNSAMKQHVEDCPKRTDFCKGCFQFVLRRDYDNHYNLQHSKCCYAVVKCCPYCKTGSFSKTTFQYHKPHCRKKDDWKFLCNFCDDMFDDETLYNEHMKESMSVHLRLASIVVHDQSNQLRDLITQLKNSTIKLQTIERKQKDCKTLTEKCNEMLNEQTLTSRMERLSLTTSTVFTSMQDVLNQPAISRGILFIWKITNFHFHSAQATQSSDAYSIYSAPFYTSDFGYKLCLRAYPNGDGQGINSHFSLFIMILCGDYDAILKWPFLQLVTLTLLNPYSNQNVSQKFRTIPTSLCFERPNHQGYNHASGCACFILKSKLPSYLVPQDNGTLYIQAKIS